MGAALTICWTPSFKGEVLACSVPKATTKEEHGGHGGRHKWKPHQLAEEPRMKSRWPIISGTPMWAKIHPTFLLKYTTHSNLSTHPVSTRAIVPSPIWAVTTRELPSMRSIQYKGAPRFRFMITAGHSGARGRRRAEWREKPFGWHGAQEYYEYGRHTPCCSWVGIQLKAPPPPPPPPANSNG